MDDDYEALVNAAEKGTLDDLRVILDHGTKEGKTSPSGIFPCLPNPNSTSTLTDAISLADQTIELFNPTPNR